MPYMFRPHCSLLLPASPGAQVALVVGKKRTIAAEKRQKKEQKEEAERHMAKQEQLVSAGIARFNVEVNRRRVGQHCTGLFQSSVCCLAMRVQLACAGLLACCCCLSHVFTPPALPFCSLSAPSSRSTCCSSCITSTSTERVSRRRCARSRRRRARWVDRDREGGLVAVSVAGSGLATRQQVPFLAGQLLQVTLDDAVMLESLTFRCSSRHPPFQGCAPTNLGFRCTASVVSPPDIASPSSRPPDRVPRACA